MMYEDDRIAMAETAAVAEKRLPYVREEMTRLAALVDKMDARAGELRERLAPILANRPPLDPAQKAPGYPDDVPSLAQELRQFNERLEKIMLLMEDTQSRVEV